MNACITQETFVLQFFGECFIRLWNSNYVDTHVDVEIQLFRHVDMEKNMPTTALVWYTLLTLMFRIKQYFSDKLWTIVKIILLLLTLSLKLIFYITHFQLQILLTLLQY